MDVPQQPGVQDATCRSLVAALCRKIAGSGSEASGNGIAWQHACHRRLMDTAYTILLDLTPEALPRSGDAERPHANSTSLAQVYLWLTEQRRYDDAEVVQVLAERLASQRTIALPALGEYHGAVPVSHVPLSEHQALLSLLLQLRGTATTCDAGEESNGVSKARAGHAAALPPGYSPLSQPQVGTMPLLLGLSQPSYNMPNLNASSAHTVVPPAAASLSAAARMAPAESGVQSGVVSGVGYAIGSSAEVAAAAAIYAWGSWHPFRDGAGLPTDPFLAAQSGQQHSWAVDDGAGAPGGVAGGVEGWLPRQQASGLLLASAPAMQPPAASMRAAAAPGTTAPAASIVAYTSVSATSDAWQPSPLPPRPALMPAAAPGPKEEAKDGLAGWLPSASGGGWLGLGLEGEGGLGTGAAMSGLLGDALVEVSIGAFVAGSAWVPGQGAGGHRGFGAMPGLTGSQALQQGGSAAASSHGQGSGFASQRQSPQLPRLQLVAHTHSRYGQLRPETGSVDQHQLGGGRAVGVAERQVQRQRGGSCLDEGRLSDLALLALRGVVAAVAELQELCSRPAPAFMPTASRACLSSAQRQLLSRIVRTAHMRLRLDAFLLHHKAWATATWPAGQQPGPVAGAGARGGTAADAGTEAAENGQGEGKAGGGAANPIMQAFLACLEELLAMQTSALQALPEHVRQSQAGVAAQVQGDWATPAAGGGIRAGGNGFLLQGDWGAGPAALRDSASSWELEAAGGAARKGRGGDRSQLEAGAKSQRRGRVQRVTDREQAGAASGAPVTLLEVWMFSSRLAEQLQQLCGICRCVPLADTLAPHAGAPPPAPLNPSAGLGTGPAAGPGACRREACGRLHAGSGLLSCWQMQQQLRVLGLGPCLWELQGFPSGNQLLDLLYQGVMSSIAPTTLLLLKLLLSRTLQPLTSHVWEWVHTTRPPTHGFTLLQGSPPLLNAGAAFEPYPASLPQFLSGVERMYRVAGWQLRLLAALRPRIGPLSERLQLIAQAEAAEARQLVQRSLDVAGVAAVAAVVPGVQDGSSKQDAGQGGGGLMLVAASSDGTLQGLGAGGAGGLLQQPGAGDQGDGEGGYQLEFELSRLQQLSRASERWTELREAELDRVLDLLERRRVAEAAAAALQVVAKRQERLGAEEAERRRSREQQAAQRAAREKLLQELLRDAQAAKASKAAAHVAEVEEERAMLLEAVMREHQQAQDLLHQELRLAQIQAQALGSGVQGLGTSPPATPRRLRGAAATGAARQLGLGPGGGGEGSAGAALRLGSPARGGSVRAAGRGRLTPTSGSRMRWQAGESGGGVHGDSGAGVDAGGAGGKALEARAGAGAGPSAGQGEMEVDEDMGVGGDASQPPAAEAALAAQQGTRQGLGFRAGDAQAGGTAAGVGSVGPASVRSRSVAGTGLPGSPAGSRAGGVVKGVEGVGARGGVGGGHRRWAPRPAAGMPSAWDTQPAFIVGSEGMVAGTQGRGLGGGRGRGRGQAGGARDAAQLQQLQQLQQQKGGRTAESSRPASRSGFRVGGSQAGSGFASPRTMRSGWGLASSSGARGARGGVGVASGAASPRVLQQQPGQLAQPARRRWEARATPPLGGALLRQQQQGPGNTSRNSMDGIEQEGEGVLSDRSVDSEGVGWCEGSDSGGSFHTDGSDAEGTGAGAASHVVGHNLQDAPASSAVQVCLCEAVQAQYRLTTRAVWALAVHELRYLDECRALRHFFLMEAGDFAQLLCDRLLSLLESSEPLASSGSSIQGGRRALGAQALAMALDEARTGSSCAGDPYATRLSLLPAPGRDVCSHTAAGASDDAPTGSGGRVSAGGSGAGASGSAGAGSAGAGSADALAWFRAEARRTDAALLTYAPPWPQGELLGFSAGAEGRGALAHHGGAWASGGGGGGGSPVRHRVGSGGSGAQARCAVVAAYAACFSSLLRLRAAKSRLAAAWLALAKPTLQQQLDQQVAEQQAREAAAKGRGSAADGEGQAAAVLQQRRQRMERRLRALRMWHHQALHFVSALQQHMQGQLLGSCWAHLEAELTQRGPIDVLQMQAVHVRYLRHAMRVCLLPPHTCRLLEDSATEDSDGVGPGRRRPDGGDAGSEGVWVSGLGLGLGASEAVHGGRSARTTSSLGGARAAGRTTISGGGAGRGSLEPGTSEVEHDEAQAQTRAVVSAALRACEVYALVSLAAPASPDAGPRQGPGAGATGHVSTVGDSGSGGGGGNARPIGGWYELLKESHKEVDAAIRAAVRQLHVAASADPAAAGLLAALGCAFYDSHL